jgi:hypothetical protein
MWPMMVNSAMFFMRPAPVVCRFRRSPAGGGRRPASAAIREGSNRQGLEALIVVDAGRPRLRQGHRQKNRPHQRERVLGEETSRSPVHHPRRVRVPMTHGHHADPAAAMMTANPTNDRNSRPACQSEHPPVSAAWSRRLVGRVGTQPEALGGRARRPRGGSPPPGFRLTATSAGLNGHAIRNASLGRRCDPEVAFLRRDEARARQSRQRGGEAGYCHLGPVMNPAGAGAVGAA